MLARLFAALVAGTMSVGCAGLYVEGLATFHPSLKYTESSSPNPNLKVDPGSTSGAGLGVGINIGLAFEGRRAGRFSLGYVQQSTSVPGGRASGGISDARFDVRVARIGKRDRIRIGFGFGFGSGGTTKMTKPGGGDVSDKGGGGGAYAGPVWAHYFGTKGIHEVSAMLAGGYSLFSAPNGIVSGVGVGIRVAYTLMFGDTRPHSVHVSLLDTSKNLMPQVEAGAKRAGCTATYEEHRGETSSGERGLVGAEVNARCPGEDEDIQFFQVKQGILITCPRLDEDQCRLLEDKILAGGKSEGN
jgi:hypothetical protein